MRNVSDKSCSENQTIYWVLSNIFFENPTVDAIMLKNTVERGRRLATIMAVVHCMLDNYGYNYTHSGCVILIAFPLQR